MKKFIIILVSFAVSLGAFARGPLSDGDMDVISAIASRSASIQSFSGKFKQTRQLAILNEPAVSSGEMQYRNDGRLLWKYVSPKPFQIAFTSDEVRINAAGGESVIPLDENPLLAKVRALLIGIMSGSNISAPEGFDLSVTGGTGSGVTIDMIPSSRATRRLFRSLGMTFSAGDLLIEKVVMEEADGSTTTISFYDRIIK